MRYIECCKSTRKNKKCTRKDGKHFSLQRKFTKKRCIKGPVKGFTMRSSCAPYKFCKNKTRKNQRGGGDPSTDDCPICLEPLNEGTIIDVHKSVEAQENPPTSGPEKHYFHKNCTEGLQNNNCPLCRSPMEYYPNGAPGAPRWPREYISPYTDRTVSQEDMRDNLVFNNGYYYEEGFGEGPGEGFNYPCCSPCKHKGICDAIMGCGRKYCYACNQNLEADENFERKCKEGSHPHPVNARNIPGLREGNWYHGLMRNDIDNPMRVPVNVGRREQTPPRLRRRRQEGIMAGGSDPEEKTQLPNLQQSADLLRTSLGIHRQGQNAMWERQVIRLALEGDERFTHLLGEEPLVARKEQDPQDGGRVTRRKKRKKRKKKTRKKQFLYNPNDPSKSFDVYIDKNPKDTIPIKYTTVKDVKDTIKKLERLYKTKKYPHKRIWQVGMIMKVRLEAMLKHKTKKYPNAKKVKQRFNLANKYFKFLGKRTKKKDFKSRKGMTFKF